MNVNSPLEIDLLCFIKTGTFGKIKLGLKKQQVLNILPEPDDCSSPNENEFEILSYGSIELHFKNNKLFLIFTDNINTKKTQQTFYTGDLLAFKNQWIFGDEEQALKLPYVLKSFLNDKINYHIKWNKYGGDALEIITEGNVSLLFEPPNTSTTTKSYKLVALSLFDEKYI